MGRPSRADLAQIWRPFFAIALPAVATQVSTPFGNWVLIKAMAAHGESAVAGLGVVARLQILGFGGIFARRVPLVGSSARTMAQACMIGCAKPMLTP